MRVFAIDFGSSNTVVAVRSERGATLLTLPGLSLADNAAQPPLIPSAVYVRDARKAAVLVGDQIRAAGLDQADDPRYLRGFKRRIAAEIQGLNPDLDGLEVLPERVAGWFLTELLRAVPGLDRDRDLVVFTVPVGSFQRYLAWIESFWPVRHWRVVDESTAAALGYGVAAPGRRVLTCDLGGGTVDLSLVRLPDTFDAAGQPLTSTVLAKASQILGGDDIDGWLLDAILARLDLAVTVTEPVRRSWLRAAERAKIQLSTKPSAEFWAVAADGTPHHLELSRDELEEALICHDFLPRLQQSIDTVLRQAQRRGLDKDDIDQVLLVGGTGQIPAVRRALQQNFGAARVRSEHVFTAAALGGATLGAGYEVRDFLYHSYAVRGWNHASRRHEYDLVVPALSPYPFDQPVVREYAASTPNQAAMELFLGEIEHGDVSRPEVVVEDQRVRVLNAPSPLHRYALVEADRAVPLHNGTVVKLEPPGHPGVNRLRVQFQVDDQRRLRLTVYDLQTNLVLLRDHTVALLT
ncbi:MAG: Hsp70 family protein [Fimbriimonadaceae bacterium]|nr:Hsp70 family protein [Fimbriimonadaceae bacterium]